VKVSAHTHGSRLAQLGLGGLIVVEAALNNGLSQLRIKRTGSGGPHFGAVLRRGQALLDMVKTEALPEKVVVGTGPFPNGGIHRGWRQKQGCFSVLEFNPDLRLIPATEVEKVAAAAKRIMLRWISSDGVSAEEQTTLRKELGQSLTTGTKILGGSHGRSLRSRPSQDLGA